MNNVSKNLLSASPLIKNRYFILIAEKQFLSIGVQNYLDELTNLSFGTLSTFIRNEDVFDFENFKDIDPSYSPYYIFVDSIRGIWRNFILNMLFDYNKKYHNHIEAWDDFISYFDINSKENSQSIFIMSHIDNSSEYPTLYSLKAISHSKNIDPLIDIDLYINKENTLFELQIPSARIGGLDNNYIIDTYYDSFDDIKENSYVLNPNFN